MKAPDSRPRFHPSRLMHGLSYRAAVLGRRLQYFWKRRFGRNAGEAYHFWYYEMDLQTQLTFEGVRIRKSVQDLWIYQELLWEMKPSVIVEFGTKYGGSALWFARILDALGTGRVITVDPQASRVEARVAMHPRIDVRDGLSTDPDLIAELAQLRASDPEPWFLILDSDHTRDNVFAELVAVTPFLRPGDRVIVEDGNINGHPVVPDWGPGPYEAIQDFHRECPGAYRTDRASEQKFGWTFAPSGFLIRQ